MREYLEDMASAYGAADLVVCRSGASTLAELAAQRAPAVLVPYPHAAADHQDANARVFELAGAAVRLPEDELDGALGRDSGRFAKVATARRDGGARWPRLTDGSACRRPTKTVDAFVDALEKRRPIMKRPRILVCNDDGVTRTRACPR